MVVSILTTPTRPLLETDQPLFYRLPARLLVRGMTATDGQGCDIDSVTITEAGVEYTVVVDTDDAGNDLCEIRTAGLDELVQLAVFWDTAVDGSTLPEAVDVRTR